MKLKSEKSNEYSCTDYCSLSGTREGIPDYLIKIAFIPRMATF